MTHCNLLLLSAIPLEIGSKAKVKQFIQMQILSHLRYLMQMLLDLNSIQAWLQKRIEGHCKVDFFRK